MLKIILVAGARPNFMKIAPLVAAMKRRGAEFQPILVHTGQHYDASMSDAFFRDLEMPKADVHLGVGSASHAAQTAAIMLAFEPVVLRSVESSVPDASSRPSSAMHGDRTPTRAAGARSVQS